MVQAHDALTRTLTLGRNGKVDRTVRVVGEDAMAPPAPERIDLFGSSRTLLLWAGLLAGALMALAFILRPLVDADCPALSGDQATSAAERPLRPGEGVPTPPDGYARRQRAGRIRVRSGTWHAGECDTAPETGAVSSGGG